MLAGECVLLVEGEERRLKQWDFVHCPACREHIFVGAGDDPCVLFMVGSRTGEWNVRYPVSELAASHAASVEREVTSPDEALGVAAATIGAQTYGGDLASTWSIHPDELQAEVAGWPRKSTGKTQVRRTISHSLPRET